MKKFAMLALAMSLFLVACGEKKEEQKPAEQPAAEATTTTTEAPATETAATEAVNYTVKTEDGKEFTVAINGDVATITDAEGKATELNRAESADGERFTDANGNEIHVKGEEGILTLGDVKEAVITVTEAAK